MKIIRVLMLIGVFLIIGSPFLPIYLFQGVPLLKGESFLFPATTIGLAFFFFGATSLYLVEKSWVFGYTRYNISKWLSFLSFIIYLPLVPGLICPSLFTPVLVFLMLPISQVGALALFTIWHFMVAQKSNISKRNFFIACLLMFSVCSEGLFILLYSDRDDIRVLIKLLG